MNSHGVHSPKFPVAGNFLAKDLIVFAKWQQQLLIAVVA